MEINKKRRRTSFLAAVALVAAFGLPATAAFADGDSSSPSPSATVEQSTASPSTDTTATESEPTEASPTAAVEESATADPAPAKEPATAKAKATTEPKASAPKAKAKATAKATESATADPEPAKSESTKSTSKAAAASLVVLDPANAVGAIPVICVDGAEQWDIDTVPAGGLVADNGRVRLYTSWAEGGDIVVGFPVSGYTYDPSGQEEWSHNFGTGTGNPCGEPTPTPTVTPTVDPTPTPTETPTVTPTETPTVDPTPTDTASPTPTEPTETPTATPTVDPTVDPSPTPTEPTPTPTDPTTPPEAVAPSASLKVSCEVIEGANTGWVLAELTIDNKASQVDAEVVVYSTEGSGQGYEDILTVPAGEAETFPGYFEAGGTLLIVVYWGEEMILDQSDDTQQCVVDVVTPTPTPTVEPTPTASPTVDPTAEPSATPTASKPAHDKGKWSDGKAKTKAKAKVKVRGISPNTNPGEEEPSSGSSTAWLLVTGIGVLGLLGMGAAEVAAMRRRRH